MKNRIFLLSPANCGGIRAKRVVSDAAQFPLVHPGAGGRSSRASGIIVLILRAKDLRQTSLLPNGPGT